MSDESPHHPGPWRQHRERDWLILDADDGILPSITVATVHGNDADARLIAAAPELMALLEGDFVRHHVTLACNACGVGPSGHGVGCPIGDLLARIDGRDTAQPAR